jgi:hypothetical protein
MVKSHHTAKDRKGENRMKLYQLVESNDSLKKLNTAEGLPFKTALSIARDIKNIEEVLQVYENKRKELVNKYGEKDENGELVIKDDSVKLTDRAAFVNEFNALAMEDVDIEIKKISVDDLENVTSLTPSDINNISFLLEEGKEEKTNE